jgi:stage II sporulation protein D (peptidoglycan lytic transglycosylase)
MRNRHSFTGALAVCAAGLALHAWGASGSGATDLSPVRVRLASLGTPPRVTVRAQGPLRAADPSTGEELEVSPGSLTITAEKRQLTVGEKQVSLLRLDADALTVEVGRVVRTYPGTLLLSASGGGITLINECSLERYTEGVLACECPSLFHPEAIKAMAVAARSYSYRKALVARGDLCDTTHCQVYRGVGWVPASIRKAVGATAGVFALYGDKVIDAVYSADCGGYTEANEDAWKGARPAPYLRPVEDAPEPHGEPYCAVNRSHKWKVTLPAVRLQSLYGKPETDLKLDLVDLTASGRVRKLRIIPAVPAGEGAPVKAGAQEKEKASEPTGAPRLFNADQWRRMLGKATLKSLKFDVRVTDKGVEIEGRGFGHGVGLCQFGSHGMARQGVPFDEILKHYYTGIDVAPLPTVAEARSRAAKERASAQ